MAIHICHSSFLQGHFTASRHWKGRARTQGDGWQREGQPDSSSELMAGWSRQWRTGGRNKSLIFLYQGAWSIDGPESLSSKSRGFMGSARGSGSLDDRKTHMLYHIQSSSFSSLLSFSANIWKLSHKQHRATHTVQHSRMLWKYNKPFVKCNQLQSSYALSRNHPFCRFYISSSELTETKW